MKSPSKADLIEHIVKSLAENKTKAKRQFMNGSGLQYFIIDNLLPSKWCQEINRSFPETSKMTLKKAYGKTSLLASNLKNIKPLLRKYCTHFKIKPLYHTFKKYVD